MVTQKKKLRSLQFTQAKYFTIDGLNILSDISSTFQKDKLLITDIAVKCVAGLIKLKVLKQLIGKAFTEYTASAESSDTQKAALLSFIDQLLAARSPPLEHMYPVPRPTKDAAIAAQVPRPTKDQLLAARSPPLEDMYPVPRPTKDQQLAARSLPLEHRYSDQPRTNYWQHGRHH